MGGAQRLRRPCPAPRGAILGLCAPGGPVDGPTLDAGVSWLEGEGYRVRFGANLHRRSGYLAGTDDERLSDLRTLIRDPDVSAILLARGGYGISRILRALDPDELRACRKLFVGYSDATALLIHLRECAGLASVHGPMLDRTDLTTAARDRLLALLRGESGEPLEGRSESGGRTRGPLVGGNLTLVAASLGTASEIDTRGAILFLEEKGEAPYRIDRMLVQLRDAGKLGAAAGVAFGSLVEEGGERYPGPTAGEVVEELVVPEVAGPVVTDLPFGHVADNRAIGVGVEGLLEGEAETLEVLGPVVEEAP